MRTLKKLHVTVFGLGLHGGGVSACKFCVAQGAHVTVTDLKTEHDLQKSLSQLKDLPIRYVLGTHKRRDFSCADIVIKNAAIATDHPLLRSAKWIESDLSLFFRFVHPETFVVTGSKGKSSTAALMHFILSRLYSHTYLAGNIGLSPLDLLYKKLPVNKLVLELSSFQIEDLYRIKKQKLVNTLPIIFQQPLKLNISTITFTNIYPDHMNRYGNMQKYIGAKKKIFSFPCPIQIYNYDNHYCRTIAQKQNANIFFFSKQQPTDKQTIVWSVGKRIWLKGENKALPNKGFLTRPCTLSITCAATAGLIAYGIPAHILITYLPQFTGIAHRMEHLGTWKGRTFYNDTTASIPHATYWGVKNFHQPVILITGGTDKNIDFSLFTDIAQKVKLIFLIEGSASKKIASVLEHINYSFFGPYLSLDQAFVEAWEHSKNKDIILFSPASSSFEKYPNEFERGRHFRSLVHKLCM